MDDHDYKAIYASSRLAASLDSLPEPRAHECPYEVCESKFACSHPYCEERFFFSSNLIIHKRTHILPGKHRSSTPLQQDTSPYIDTRLSQRDSMIDQDASIVDSEGSLNSPGYREDADLLAGHSNSILPLANTVHQSAPLSELPFSVSSSSHSPRRRSDSANSVGSCGSAASGNSDPKSLSEDLPDFFETAQIPRHWKTGASILHGLNQAQSRLNLLHLSNAIESLSSATKEVNLNAKAWSAIESILARHSQNLKSYSASHGTSAPVEGYIKVLKEVLALWVRTIDPLITLAYSALPANQMPSQFSQDRHELFLLTQNYGTGPTDENRIDGQKIQLEEAFKGTVREISAGDVPPEKSLHSESPLVKSELRLPKQAPSMWQIYFSDWLQDYKAHHPHETLNVAQAAKEAGRLYKNLDEKAKQDLKRRAEVEREERQRLLATWQRHLTQNDIKRENEFQNAPSKAVLSRRVNIKDPNAPKKPLSAYFIFLTKIRGDPVLVQEVFGDETETTRQSVLAARRWREMSDEEKKPFLAQAEHDKTQYDELCKLYEDQQNSKPGSSSPTRAFGTGYVVPRQMESSTDSGTTTLQAGPYSSDSKEFRSVFYDPKATITTYRPISKRAPNSNFSTGSVHQRTIRNVTRISNVGSASGSLFQSQHQTREVDNYNEYSESDDEWVPGKSI